jgi:pimeloyl-ACP methyl ester carboxylesterase
VLLHAGVADRRGWYDVAEGLAGREVVAYDRRGHGESAVFAAPFTGVGDLLLLLADVVTEPAWLVGSSMGGGVALDAALTLPTAVAGLVLIAPAVSGAPKPEIDADTEALGDRLEAAEEAGDLDEVNRFETWIWLDGPSSSEGRVTGSARDLFLEMNRIVLRNEVPEGAGDSGVDAWGRLSEVEVPVVVVCGDLDVPFLVERSRVLAERLPNARYHEIAGMAHMPYLEDPAVLVELLQEALGG